MGKLWNLLRQINFGLDIFILFFLLFESQIVIPELLQVPGRAHPLILHFPIVVLFIVPFLPFILKYFDHGKELHREFYKNYLSLTHFLCALTVLFGLILSQEEGYGGSTVFWHKWTGVAVLGSILVLELVLQYVKKGIKIFKYGSIISVIILMATGHFGATLTHGAEFLTEPIKAKVEKVPLEEADLFAHVIYPVLDNKCISCHNPNKSKGDLILMDSTGIMAGGENGPAISRESPGKSLLIENIMLDINHDDHMPPKGKPQLTPSEMELLKSWVAHGALFNHPVADLEREDSLFQLVQAVYSADEKPAYEFQAASKKTVEKLNDNYRLLVPLAAESPALYGRFLSRRQFREGQLKELQEVSEQLVDLNLQNLELSSSATKHLSGFKNLQVLNLNNTGITDESLVHLKGLEELYALSLIGTNVTFNGISDLLEVNPIRKIYIWNTEITGDEKNELQKRFSNIKLIGKSDQFGTAPIALNQPFLEPEAMFFKDSLRLEAGHVINGVKIRYTEDGSEPDSIGSMLYESPILFSEDKEFKFKAYKEGWLGSKSVSAAFYRAKYTPDSIQLISKPNEKYKGTGGEGLIDMKAGPEDHQDRAYLGYRQNQMEVEFQFGEEIELSEIVVSEIVKTNSYIFPPSEIEVYASEKGVEYEKVMTYTPEQPQSFKVQKKMESIKLPLQKLKGVKLIIKQVNSLPQWHRVKGDKAWVFIDEVLFR